ncbi:MAG: hypothetical protein IEMM0008_1333 [bacterium]|nr:MAG: hypothetical protein IEMM0008_1333 [bacterium]
MKTIQTVLVLFFIAGLVNGKQEKRLLVTHRKARVFSLPSAFSKQYTRLKFGKVVVVKGVIGKWVEVYSLILKGKGYIHQDALITREKFKRQEEVVEKRKARLLKKGKKNFSEEDEVSISVKGFSEKNEVSAGSKGFSEEDETSAGSKAFSEKDEVSAGSKGFSEEDEVSAAPKGSAKKMKRSLLQKGLRRPTLLPLAQRKALVVV